VGDGLVSEEPVPLPQFHLTEPPQVVRITFFPELALPYIEIWGPGPEHAYASILRPMGFSDEEWLALLASGRTYVFQPGHGAAPQVIGTASFREYVHDARARLEYDERRGIVVNAWMVWRCLGWDCSAMTELRHPSQAVDVLFNTPKWRPDDAALAEFRAGFAAHVKGERRPVVRG
jgi:hypothetical protein